MKRFSSSQICSYREGNYCWANDSSSSLKQFNIYILVILSLALLILIISVRALIRRINDRERERERKDFILKAIAHEIRSPITALKLIMDNIKKDFDVLPTSLQFSFFEALSQVSRLNTVVDKSRQYLGADSDSILDLKICEIESIESFFLSILEYFEEEKIKLELEEDFSFRTDPYWLSVAIKNLVENGIKHGIEPIIIRVSLKEKVISIEIEDSGSQEFEKDIFKDFEKSDSSSGLGLGLYLVKKIVASLEGKVKLQSRPTRFSILLGSHEENTINRR